MSEGEAGGGAAKQSGDGLQFLQAKERLPGKVFAKLHHHCAMDFA